MVGAPWLLPFLGSHALHLPPSRHLLPDSALASRTQHPHPMENGMNPESIFPTRSPPLTPVKKMPTWRCRCRKRPAIADALRAGCDASIHATPKASMTRCLQCIKSLIRFPNSVFSVVRCL
ncbi:uncharacterized protein LOC117927267 [Vitis riparia]|uniref:uncharacterized protein LOC117927267 n=1 Tax=Vitis riparia TaxID=96939 RepID=UPI00155A205A|nr:uncharacterized protein LOC117927267 [Vitis riparia]